MSLDFSLYEEDTAICGHCGYKISIMGEELFERNITHNINGMAMSAGIYKILWHPEDVKSIVYAKDMVRPLTEGLRILKAEPERFERLRPENGWGTYESFMGFVEAVISACIEYPKALVVTCT